MSDHGSIRGLPVPFARWLPELDAVDWPSESRSTCSSCPLVDDPKARFHADVRCCTYHPTLPNFLVGSALRRGGVGADLVLARIEKGDGVGPLGVAPPKGWRDKYFAKDVGFGRDLTLRCPYWAGGEHSCGIWADRNGTCRTWFCKHDDGARGMRLWGALREALQAVEDHLAAACAREIRAPRAPATVSQWAAFYVACAELADRWEGDPPARLAELRQRIAGHDAARHEPLPDYVVPSLKDAVAGDGVVLLEGWSDWDRFEAPPEVTELFKWLDGTRHWRVALGAVESRTGVRLGEDLVRRLWRSGLLARVAPPTSA